MGNRDVGEIAKRMKALMQREGDFAWDWCAVAVTADSEDQLREAAELAGFFETHTWGTLKGWRNIGLAWLVPEDRRVSGMSFTAHAELYADPERFAKARPGLTKREARFLAGKKPMIDDAARRGVALVGLLDAGSEDLDETQKDAVLRAASRIVADREAIAREHGGGTARAKDSFLSLEGRAQSVIRALKAILREADDLAAEPAAELAQIFEEIEEVAAAGASSLRSGQIDEELAALLRDS